MNQSLFTFEQAIVDAEQSQLVAIVLVLDLLRTPLTPPSPAATFVPDVKGATPILPYPRSAQ